MATHARRLAEQNGVGHKVQILEGYMEQQTLPEKERHSSHSHRSDSPFTLDWRTFLGHQERSDLPSKEP